MEDNNKQQKTYKEEMHNKAIENARKVIEIDTRESKDNGEER